MSQLFRNMCAKPVGHLELVAIVCMIIYNNTVSQEDNISFFILWQEYVHLDLYLNFLGLPYM